MKLVNRLLLLTNGILLGILAFLLKKVKLPAFPMSVLAARHPDDLNEGFPPEADGAHPSKRKNAFEWWYFDASFTDGHTCVPIILNPDIFGNHPKEVQVSIHINTPEGESHDIKVNHPREMLRASTEGCDVEVRGSTIKGGYPEWRVDLVNEPTDDQIGAEAHLTFTSLTPGWIRGDGQLVFAGVTRPWLKFGWFVPQPRASVKGTISYGGKTFEVEGEGYHDHNWADFSMLARVNRWHWGRIISDDITLVFADMVTNGICGGTRMPIVMIARGDHIAFESYEMEFRYDHYELDSTGTQAYARDISFTFAERDVSGRFDIHPKEVLELNDLLKLSGVPGGLRGPLGKYVAQPTYFRLLSDYRGEIGFGGEKVVLEGETIIEYMVFGLKRGQVPEEWPYRNYVHA